MTASIAEPDRDCPRCPRLVACRQANREAQPDWHNAPVPSFGPMNARLLIVGLAPGRKGANRTGRPFTGDYAGDLLFPTLVKFGFAKGRYVASRSGPWADDRLRLVGARIANAVRCLPPQNKPLPAEIAACRPFLVAEIAALRRLKAIMALGRIAHDTVLVALGLRPVAYPFAHGAAHDLPSGTALVDSYHCSRQNTNTGRLTQAMFEAVVADLRRRIG